MEKTRAKVRTATAVLATAATAAGCSGILGPPKDGLITATIADGSTQGVQAMAAAAGPSTSSASLAGSTSGTVRILLYREPGGWIPVGEPAGVSLTLQSGRAATIVTDAPVEAGTYTQVRLVLEGFQATLEPGSVVADVTLDSSVSIVVGGRDNYMEVQKDIPQIEVGDDVNADLSFDLGSDVWVTSRVLADLVAFDDEIKAAMTVQARVR